MGIKFDSFPIRGIDVSYWNDVINWSKVPACNFVVIRGGFSYVLDGRFEEYWAGSKGKLNRMMYWYMDYYSNHMTGSSVYGMTNAAWGKRQAQAMWNAVKDDFEGMLWLDIEDGVSAGIPKIRTVTSRAQEIAKACLEEIDRLSGKTTGIYCSLGLIPWFSSWFKTRPLWMAWYPYRTVNNLDGSDAVYSAQKQGWTGKVLMWQYSSDGDFQDRGVKDGGSFSQMADCDLNGWVASDVEYAKLFGGAVVIPETPDDEVIIPPMNTRTIPVKTARRTLTLRKKPQVSILTQIKLLPAGTVFDCLEEVRDSAGNIWQRVGIDQFVADIHNGIAYLK